ncbi:MAG: TonB family protein [Bdellovibrionales bacterium]|nr:TonB family protein [Bdellovibrionales bacterium]
MIKKKIKPIFVFLGLSLLAHFAFVLSVWIPTLIQPSQNEVEKVEVTYMDYRELPNRQIVEQQTQINDEVDENAKYLSAFDQKVIEQTKAQASGAFKNTAGGGKKSEAKNEKFEKGELPSLKKLMPSFKSENISNFDGDGKRQDEQSQTDDHIKDVKSGLQTLLSTREFVYYSYYARIKDQIRQHWGPNVREKVKIIYKQGRNIASARDRVTQVLVILDKTGSLVRVEVLSASGVVDLDAAAIEAFQQAAPFPNPPQGMVETDGTIKIRWDFILEA